MNKRIVVTGCGIISAIGIGIEKTCLSLLNEESGLSRISYLDSERDEFPVGEVKMSNEELASIARSGYPESELRSVLLGIIAGKEAINSACLPEKLIQKGAFINGTTVGGMDKTERHFESIYNSDAQCSDTSEIKYNHCGYSTELIARRLGNFQFVTTTSTACSSAANAIILGANLIKAGIVDIAVAGGAESLTRFHLNGFNSLMILDKENCRPFDKDRAGINLGEGAGYIVLESETSARERGVDIIAELSGYANTCDAFHQTASSDNGEGAYLAMKKALEMASVRPEEVDYINAHGTGTPNNDNSELAAMERIWGNKLPDFSSTKSFTGHTTSASGSIETIISLLSMTHNFIPRNMGMVFPLKEGINPVNKTKKGVVIRNVICNSFAFGGNDSTLIFSKYND